MPATDAMIARLEAEMEERNATIDGLVGLAQDANRDLTTPEIEQIGELRRRLGELSDQLDPLRETSKLAIESRNRIKQIDAELQSARTHGVVGNVEYRSAGQYVADRYLAMMGDEGALSRQEVFHRVAAHQTTADNPGLLPESIVGPLVNFVDSSRPVVSVIGPQDLGTGAWSYARVTQHTQVGLQSAEKTELRRRKMLITKTPLAAPTYGGYVNVSRQDIDGRRPQILDMVINDLAGQYAIQTEAAAAADLTAAATAGPVIPATPTAANIATAIWGAVGSVFTATKGQGRTVIAVSPDQLGAHRAAVPRRQPAERLLDRVQRRRPHPAPSVSISGLHGDHVGRLRGRHDPGVLDRRRAVLRGPLRRPAGRRAVGVGRAGRLRRGLRDRRRRGHRHRPGHHRMSTYDDPNREAVGLPPIWTGAEAGTGAAGCARASRSPSTPASTPSPRSRSTSPPTPTSAARARPRAGKNRATLVASLEGEQA